MNGTRAHRPRRQAVTVTALSQATFCSHCSSRSLDISHWRRWSKINSTNTGSRCLTTVLHWVDQLHHNTDTGVTRAWTHFTTTQTLESLQPGLTSPQHRHWSHSSLDSLHHNIDTGVAPAWTHFTTTQTLESLQPGLTSPRHRHWSHSSLDSLHYHTDTGVAPAWTHFTTQKHCRQLKQVQCSVEAALVSDAAVRKKAGNCIRAIIDRVKVLCPTGHKTGHFGYIPQANKELNLTQQKHTKKKCTTTQNKHQKN